MYNKPVSEPVEVAKGVLRRLIAFNTTTSSNPELAQSTVAATDYVGSFLAHEAGAEIHYSPPYEYPPGSGKQHKSLIAVWNPKVATDARPLAFSGHIDVVPALTSWNGKDPFVAREKEGKIIGRGALDLKGQVASFMGMMQGLHRQGALAKLQRPVVFMLSSCEEVGLEGATDVCNLVRKHNLVPGEVVVLEPTDGYIGLGCKGGVSEEIAFTRRAAAGAAWPKYCTVTVESKGGHSSLQGAGPADPAVAAVTVLERVRQLRSRGVPIEICDVRYGVADNVVGGTATITVGYNQYGFSGLKHYLESRVAPLSNLELAVDTYAGNAINWWKNQVRGMDFGSVSIKVTGGAAAGASHPKTLVKRDGALRSDSAVEQALETVKRIYEVHYDQKGKGAPQDYAIPLLGYTKLSVPMIHGNSQQASLTYDIRYPSEAVSRTDAKGVEPLDSVIARIHAGASANPGIEAAMHENSRIPPYNVSTRDERLADYLEIARRAGFLKFASPMTNLPYGSDGNIISRELPGDTLVVTMASGGFSNNPHGENEHLSEEQIARNIDLFSGVIKGRALSADRVRTGAGGGMKR